MANTIKYTSKIIKAGALLGDTKMLLAHWNTNIPIEANLDRVRRENVFGKSSRSRVEDILAIFRQRYLMEADVAKALTVLVKNHLQPESLEKILYFHAARADALLYDVVTEVLGPMHAEGISDTDPLKLQRTLSKWVLEKKTTSVWSENTITRVARNLLASLRDFGMLEGAVNKRISPMFMPITAFAYVVFYLKQHQPSGVKLIELPDWKLFFLSGQVVEKLLFEAHQHSLLEYHVAGSVTRLTFPTETLEEYAHVLTQR